MTNTNFRHQSNQKPKSDTGYTKLCPSCESRYDTRVMLIGRPREITIQVCHPCTVRADVARLKAQGLRPII